MTEQGDRGTSGASGGMLRTAGARWISIVGHPFVMTALLVAVPQWQSSRRGALQSLLLVLVTLILPVAVLMLRQVRKGKWVNVDASNRSERPILFLVTLVGVVFVVAWLWVRDPTSQLLRGVLITAVFVIVAAVLTRWIKLSLHVAFAALTATALSLLASPIGYVLIAAVPLIAWSRIALARHTPPELLVGCLLGAATGIAIVRL